MYDLTGFQRDLLFVLASLDEPHGLAIKDELQEYYDDNVRHGRLYPNLDKLVEARLVEKGQQDRRTNEYTLSNRGRREVIARMQWERDCCPEDLLEEVEPLDIEQ
ncbi:PadR family transcriptional regulator (plasmid) [Halorientalis sp. IM1011]|uniref:helix-turn-helix transcriptional regulator n=1 Tax=Halorientalis sp. IM1011 TaxID=1932360 RepID=UPI00097CD5C2|nr:helix-turn-helix transcriptional regulator [Halorientalis sp. IM1011]AQL44812.1 PadR family transcriptional regulator [Halorientalis sp. IM1011]